MINQIEKLNEPPANDSQIEKLFFKILDLDGNGSIAPTEFIIFGANIDLPEYHKTTDADLMQEFQEADTNHDGELNLEEMTALLKSKEFLGTDFFE